MNRSRGLTVEPVMLITTTESALLRLLQLSSAALPVGGYSFSQGLEAAAEEGWLRNREEINAWLSLQLSEGHAKVDLPLLLRQMDAAQRCNADDLRRWNAWVLACRDTTELRAAEIAMGEALLRLAPPLKIDVPWQAQGETAFITSFAMVATHWHIEPKLACHGYLWSWLENQVAAATRLTALGQTAAQQLLDVVLQELPEVVNKAAGVADEEIGSSLPALALASSRHEQQYSRLFRS